MLRICRCTSTAAALFLLGITATGTQVQVTTRDIGGSSLSSTTPATCPSRSINYITHSLPQQCLTTTWASKTKSIEPSVEKVLHVIRQSFHEPRGTDDATVASPTSHGNADLGVSNSTVASNATTTTESQAASAVNPTSPVIQQPKATSEMADETDNDSPLDNANFLSFEEWKRQNLAKAGQSAENLGARTGNAGHEARRRPGGINNALDSLGEDAEIEINFGGFVNPTASAPGGPSTDTKPDYDDSVMKDDNEEAKILEEPSSARRRSKDAGKTCKERSNYASFDCAATVLKTNPECKGSNAVLVENKDNYMLNICSAKNKFFIVELCDDILIDTVVLANFEFFSSMFRTFRVSVSDRYPVKLEKWKELGTFEAQNSREVQAFLVENPLIWARYLRIEFLTHSGNEYYCPVSLLRVHGTTMMEEFNYDLKRSGTDEESESGVGEGDEVGSMDAVPDVVSAEALKERALAISHAATGTSTQGPTSITATLVEVVSDVSSVTQGSTGSSNPSCTASDGFSPYNVSTPGTLEGSRPKSTSDDRSEVCLPENKPTDSLPVPMISLSIGQSTTVSEPVNTALATDGNHSSSMNGSISASINITNIPERSAAAPPAVSSQRLSHNSTEESKATNQTLASTAKVPASSTQPPNPNPTTQESFFKTVHKRLQLLESNSTLSLQYIEEQSRILRDAFSKVEKRQLAKTTNFLENLNITVLTELREFRNQYDQIWQSTVLELSSQREQSRHEVFALSARLSLLADEIVFQKRMAILQFILILLCLGLVIFSRHGTPTNYLELPLLFQNTVGKSSASHSSYAPRFETPTASPSSTRPSSRYGLLRSFTHRRRPSDESQLSGACEGTKSPSIEYSPPTPTSQDSPDSHCGKDASSGVEDDSSDGIRDAESGAKRETRSSPATPIEKREDQGGYMADAMLEPKRARRDDELYHGGSDN